jgi:hypothetical protein
MAIERITISVPKETAAKIRKAAGDQPVSAWLTNLVEEHLEDDELERLWQEFVRDVGPPTAAEKKRVDGIMKRITKPRRRRRAA